LGKTPATNSLAATGGYAYGAVWGVGNGSSYAGVGFTPKGPNPDTEANYWTEWKSEKNGGDDPIEEGRWWDAVPFRNYADGTYRPAAPGGWTQWTFDHSDPKNLSITISFFGAHEDIHANLPGVDGDPTWVWSAPAGIDRLFFNGSRLYRSADSYSLPLSGIYIDDVTFTPVPEPASLGLLGLGAGALLLGRRRRA
jgi:hypothetical protein